MDYRHADNPTPFYKLLNPKKDDYPSLECPVCNNLCKPYKVNKEFIVFYKCRKSTAHAPAYPTIYWRIDKDGNLFY